MKKSEFRNLIREEIRKVLKETKYKVGQSVTDDNEIPFEVIKVYANKQAALNDLKGAPDIAKIMKGVKDLYTSYRPIGKDDDMKPWYLVTPEGESTPRYLVPEVQLFD